MDGMGYITSWRSEIDPVVGTWTGRSDMVPNPQEVASAE